jgi:hypothetical protein
MQTMDADLARLVRTGRISRSLAEQRASVPEELSRLLGGVPAGGAAANGKGNGLPPAAEAPTVGAPPSYTQGA